MLASFFLNQLAATLDLSFGVLAAIAAALIGYGLLITSAPVKKLWRWGAVGRRRSVIAVIIWAIGTGLVGGALAWVSIWQQKKLIRQAPTEHARETAVSVSPPLTASQVVDEMERREQDKRLAKMNRIRQVMGRQPVSTLPPPTATSQTKRIARIREGATGESKMKKDQNPNPQQIAPPKKPSTPASGISVSGPNTGIITQNQSGGSNVVNLGPPTRKFNATQETAFRQFLVNANATNGEVTISCQSMGSTEPCDFARYIAGVLQGIGWKVNFTGGMMAWGDPTKKMAEIALTVNPSSIPPLAGALQKALISAGLKVTGFNRDDAEPNSLHMFVDNIQSQ